MPRPKDYAATPVASRPHMPGYAIAPAEDGKGLLPWSWAVERLSASHNYWLATTRPDGRPHAMPVWGVWLNDAFYFSTSQRSRKARNLATNAQCVVCTEHADEAVIVEGIAEEVNGDSTLRTFAEVYNEKYSWEMDPHQGGIYAVNPTVVFAFIEVPDDFPQTATRWQFSHAQA